MATVSKVTTINAIKHLFIVIAMLALTACATQQTQSPETAKPESAETAVVDDFDGDGLEIPLDGSSLAAFDASLARVKKHTSAASYETLENAIDYLLVYDLGAKRDRATLASRLDGMTGFQVIDKVGWRKPLPQRSSPAAEKETIDT